MRDPHTSYRQLRTEAPVYYVEEYDASAAEMLAFSQKWDPRDIHLGETVYQTTTATLVAKRPRQAS